MAKGAFLAKVGTGISGNVELTQQGSAVHFVATVQGATPGLHGIHIHAVGDCSAPDFSSAGAHFNPTGAPHACPPTEPRHAGDLGNIEIGPDGRGLIDITSSAISLVPGSTSVRGLAVILHDAQDDCVSQPAGGSGTRVACALIAAQ
jgi:Cu-Zn family superoxide dismutase